MTIAAEPKGTINLPRIILVNGPPRVGKDTTYKIIQEAIHSGMVPVFHEKFSLPIKRAVSQTYSVTFDEIEENKDEPSDSFFGMTGRQVQISFSEDWLKQLHGPDVFGELCARRVWQLWAHIHDSWELPNVTPVFVISDNGFVEEANALLKTMDKTTAANCVLLLRLHRTGHNFDRDSRGYIFADDLNYTVPEHDIYADTVEDLRRQIVARVSRFLTGGEVSK